MSASFVESFIFGQNSTKLATKRVDKRVKLVFLGKALPRVSSRVLAHFLLIIGLARCARKRLMPIKVAAFDPQCFTDANQYRVAFCNEKATDTLCRPVPGFVLG